MYGQIGVLATDGEKVQCHICGRWFKRLSVHVGPAHGMTADEYRTEFGLKARQGLVSPEQREFFVQNAKSNPEHLKRFAKAGREMLTEIAPEERAREAASRRHSAQERLEAEKSGRYVASRERANRRVSELKARGAEPEDTELPVVASGEDAPYYRPDKPRTQWGAHIRQVRGGLELVERSCMVCGSRYLTPKSRPRKTCSDACKKEVRRAQAAIMNERRAKG